MQEYFSQKAITEQAFMLWDLFGGVFLSCLRILFIIMAAWIIGRLAAKAVGVMQTRIARSFGDVEAAKRAETLGRVFRYLLTVIISIVSGILILSEVGISVAPILGAAGVVGLAVGFGAQSLVKDYFTGFFLLLENQIRQGDMVKLGDHAGTVEAVTLRYVQLRDYSGNVHFIPNSNITTVINMSRGFAHAVIDVTISYGADIDHALKIMRQVATELRQAAEFKTRILEDLEIAGVDSWADSAIILRARFKVVALEQWSVKREFLRRLKYAFDAENIGIPFPQMTLHFANNQLSALLPDKAEIT